MAGKHGNKMSKASSEAAGVGPVQVKSEPEAETASTAKKRKDISPSAKVWNDDDDDEAKSCPKCHTNLLLISKKKYQGTSEKEVVKECSACSNLDKEIEATIKGILAPNDDRRRPFSKAAKIPKTVESVNTNSPRVLSPSVDYQPATIKFSGTTVDSAGLWKGIDLGQPEKDLLEAVNERYPDTFKRVKIRSQPHWGSFLGALHVFIKRFLESSVDALAENGITSLEEDLDDFENLGFDLLWARERLEMVKNLKFGNDPLMLKVMVDEESVKAASKEMIEASVRLEKARLDYHRAIDAQTKTINEVAQKFGAKYDGVLNGNLGFGMLPGH